MPILDWLNKKQAVKTASKVPYKVLVENKELSYGDQTLGNMLIKGDNLEALKALLPYYKGKVKCIYIDPPYNTGSAFEHYDDNLEHSTWLSMMYPRLELLRDLLAEDGSIWVSLDDTEQAYLKVIMDELFGRKNFVSNVIWQKKFSPSNDAKWLSDNHDFIVVYAKNKEIWRPNLLPRTAEANARYTNPDGDPRGPWTSGSLQVKTPNPKDIYEIISPNGRKTLPPQGTSWRFSKEKMEILIKENRIWFGKDGSAAPRLKRFLTDVKNGITALTVWLNDEVGHNQSAKEEVKQFNKEDVFTTPKPEKLIQKVIILASNPGDIVLDSFLGSGTTAAVAQKMGRKYIGIEMGEHSITHCVPRLKQVIDGTDQGGISKNVNWQGGGGYTFYDLGPAIFDDKDNINPSIKFKDLAFHIWFSETKQPLQRYRYSPLIGICEDTAYYLLYNGVLGDKSVNGGNVLTTKILDKLPKHNGPKIIYGEACRLSKERLLKEQIIFKQTPYDVKSR